MLPRQTARLGVRLVTNAIVPLAVAYLVISFLTDPTRINTGELSANSLLMHDRPFFRDAPGDELRNAIGASAILLVVAMAWATSLGVGAAFAYGWSSNRVFRTVAWTVATVAASLPAFFWAIAIELVMIFLWLQFGVRPFPIAGFGIDDHLVLPALALGLRPAAYIFRLTALAVSEARHADYVRTAIGKGIGERSVLARHVLPNVLPNIVSATVLATRGALSGLVIIEYVYVWGGGGLGFVQAVGDRHLQLAGELALAFAAASVLLTAAAEAARARVEVTA